MEGIAKVKINESVGPGTDVVSIDRLDLRELFVTAHPDASEGLPPLINRVARNVRQRDAKVVKMDIFGTNDAFIECKNSIEKAFGQINWPITYVEGDTSSAQEIAGMHIHAISGVPVETIYYNDSPLGRVFADQFARYCILGNVHPDNLSSSQEEQARQTFENMERGLKLAGMGMENIVRTWFFNKDILDWYKEFNSVRTMFYKEKGIFDGLLPASTGIGGDNPAHAALIAGAIAMQAKEDNLKVEEVPSPLQCPAYDYGSSFSRAIRVFMPDHCRVFISGTASIGLDGKTVHADNLDAQIVLTLEVVEGILKSLGMSYSGVTRANAYFKHTRDVPGLRKYCEKYGLPAARVVAAHSDICRDELLFEIEVDAISLTQ
jgi:enamine deaminase RidA (YjgF/YER057c/UK114 family)